MEKDDRLNALIQRRERINARIQNLAAKRQSEQRKRDTRKKIIAGAVLLAAAQTEPGIAQWFAKQVARLPRAEDRALFGETGDVSV
jgi:hypothetical protein